MSENGLTIVDLGSLIFSVVLHTKWQGFSSSFMFTSSFDPDYDNKAKESPQLVVLNRIALFLTELQC